MPVGAKYKPKNDNELIRLLKDGIECRDIDFSNITDLSYCFSLRENILLQDNVYFVDPNDPDLLIWNTSNVTNMNGMFYMCENFNKPVKLDASNVSYMSEMFYGCENFNKPIKMDTSKVEKMNKMFYRCKNFNQSIYFIDTSNVINFFNMFYECENFNQPVDFDVSNVSNMYAMFYGCKNLNSEIKLKNIGKNVDKVKIGYLFDSCNKLEFANIRLDITDCDKLEGKNIYKGMNIDEFCNFYKTKNNIDIKTIVNELKSLMF